MLPKKKKRGRKLCRVNWVTLSGEDKAHGHAGLRLNKDWYCSRLGWLLTEDISLLPYFSSPLLFPSLLIDPWFCSVIHSQYDSGDRLCEQIWFKPIIGVPLIGLGTGMWSSSVQRKVGSLLRVWEKDFLAPKKEEQEETDSSSCGCCHVWVWY